MVFAAPDSPPTLKLVKSVVTDDGGTAVPDDSELSASWSGGSSGFSNLGGSGIFETVPVDTSIMLSETKIPEGYLSGDWSCNGGEIVFPDIITLSLGDRVTCTITNDDIAPTLQLIKDVQNPFGVPADPNEWLLSATGSGPNAKRNFSNLGGEGVTEMVFANAVYILTESGDNLAYTPLNDGKWTCTLIYPNGDEIIIPRPISGISLKEGDSAVCTITNVQDAPSVSIEAPSKINGRLTLTAHVKGFENTVPVSFKVYKMDGTGMMVYEGYVSATPYSFSIPAKNLEAGSSYEVRANTTDGNGKSASNSVIVNIPGKGNK